MRLHVRIAHAGICSRRTAERLIQQGRVTVNGSLVVELGVKVTPEDEVSVDGEVIREARQYTVLLNKPTGVLTTLSDPQNRSTIVKYLPSYGVQLKPVGRLDMDSEGLLLITNDGDLANRLVHPRYGVEKEYQVTVAGSPTDATLEKLRKGVFIDDRKTLPCHVEAARRNVSDRETRLTFILHEGRNRQIRKMCEIVGHPVVSLKRVRIGPLTIKTMRSGEARLLGKKEVDHLRKMVGLPALSGF